MSERKRIVAQIRDSLAELAAEGVEYIGPLPRPPAAAISRPEPSTRPEPIPEPKPAPAFQPRVAPLAEPAALSAEGEDKASRLAAVRSELGECTRCVLSEKRKTIVFGEGNPEAPVVFVGEGPGDEEDRSGRPFVGRSGELLTKIIESVGWKREDIYICNIVKCRPPGNRNPALDEVAACRPFLEGQIGAIAPKAIITLGKPAISTLLGREVPITKARGIWVEWHGFPVMPTFHPAYLLRSYTQQNRQAVWDDLKAVRARVDQALGS